MTIANDSKLEQPGPPSWSSYVRHLYTTAVRPSISTYDASKLPEKAREATKNNYGALPPRLRPIYAYVPSDSCLLIPTVD